MKKAIATNLFIGLIGNAFTAHAADAPESVNPANVINNVNQTRPTSAPIFTQPTLKQPNQSLPPSNAQSNDKIVLKKVELTGATHPVPASVEAIYQRLIGQPVGFVDIQKMAADMQQAYRAAGLILVQVTVPPQEIDRVKGVVRLAIIEGQIEKVIFRKELSPALKSQLQRYATQVEAEDPISYATIDRFLLLANQLPGAQASATLSPNPRVVGGSDLAVDVKETKASGFVNYNDRGTRYIGPNQLTVGATIFNLVNADALSLIASSVPQHANQMAYANAGYEMVVGPDATNIKLSATSVRTEPGDNLNALQMQGRSTQYGLSVNQPLLVSNADRITFLSALTHVDSVNHVFTNQELYRDTITTLSAGVRYQGVLWKAYHEAELSLTQGVPILGASTQLQNPSIAGATPGFTHMNFTSSSTRYLSERASMALGMQLQWSRNKLVSSERISYGGQGFGQGFSQNVISGDSGALGALALRYDLPKPTWLPAALNLFQSEIFYDVGSVHINQASAGSSNHALGESAGAGLNLSVSNRWNVGVSLAKPLNLRYATGTDMGWKKFFNVTGVF